MYDINKSSKKHNRLKVINHNQTNFILWVDLKGCGFLKIIDFVERVKKRKKRIQNKEVFDKKSEFSIYFF